MQRTKDIFQQVRVKQDLELNPDYYLPIEILNTYKNDKKSTD